MPTVIWVGRSEQDRNRLKDGFARIRHELNSPDLKCRRYATPECAACKTRTGPIMPLRGRPVDYASSMQLAGMDRRVRHANILL